MKYPLSFFPSVAAATLLMIASASTLSAVSVFWDADATVNGTYGGDGTWDTTTANWGSAADGTGTDAAWDSANTASFLRGTSGTVSVDAGGITISANSALVFGASAGSFTTGSANYTLNGGKLTLAHASTSADVITVANGSSATINNSVEFSTALRLNALDANTSLNLAGGMIYANAANSGLSVVYAGSNSTIEVGAITKSLAGNVLFQFGGTSGNNNATYVLNGNNTGTNSISLVRGTIVANNNGALGTSAVSVSGAATTAETQAILIGTAGVTLSRTITFVNSGNTATDTRTLGSNITSGTATFSGTINLRSGGTLATNVIAAAGGTTVFSGSINDSTETLGITKTGAGIVKFTRAAGNAYDGDTTVSTGTLLVNNTSASGTGTGAVSVSNGATFGGTGTSSGAITLAAGARLSPGDMDETGVSSAGTFTGGSALTWNSNGTTAGLFFNLGADQGSSDQLALAGAFTKGTGATFIFDFTGSTLNPSITYTLVTFGSTDFVIGDFSALNGGDGVFAFDGNSLTYGASIPEPSAYAALLGLLALAGAVLRRRTTGAR